MAAPGPGGVLDPRDRTTVLVHYYRAMVGRADVWRMRMDATTNWALGATGAGISFALGSVAAPHFVVHIAALVTAGFLLLEARRLTFYHLWQHRVLLLERSLVRAAAGGDEDGPPLAETLAPHLGRTVPTMPLHRAVARRLRRVYVHLFAAQLLTWALKLQLHPGAASAPGEWLERAAVGPLSGAAFGAVTLVAFAGAAGLALAHGGVSREVPSA